MSTKAEAKTKAENHKKKAGGSSRAMEAAHGEAWVLNRAVHLLQPAEGFRTSVDSVLLAAACPAQAGQRVLDMGCGVGGAAFCVLHRVPGSHVTGVDIQPLYIALARENARLNSCEDSAEFVEAEINGYEPEARFDHVICNPPYLEAGHHIPSPVEPLARARGNDALDMTAEDWVHAGFHRLRSGGSLSIIHRADNTDRIIRAMGRRFGAIDIMPLWPKLGRNAKRVVIRGIKDRQSPSTLHAGLVLHRPDGEFTAEAEAVLREGKPLFAL